MAKAKIGINGFGRIGRLIMRASIGREDVEIVAINDPFLTPDYACYLYKYDTVHGKANSELKVTADGGLKLNRKPVAFFMEKEPEKQIFGLFLSSRIHVRTLWQFFLLNRESWLGKPIPVVPLTITQYVTLITYFYNKELPISKLLHFLQKLSKLACQVKDYKAWETAIEENINQYKL